MANDDQRCGDAPPDVRTQIETESTRLLIPSRPEWITPTIEYLQEKAVLCGACDETRAAPLAMALGEALTNAIVHGNLEISSELKRDNDDAFIEALAKRSADPHYASRTVDIHIDYRGDSCQWSLTDQGQGFDVDAVVHGFADRSLESPSGRGIVMMRTFLDNVEYQLGGRRVILTMRQSTGHEKRRHLRHVVNRPTRVVPVLPDGRIDWSAAYEAIAEDVSEGGVGLLQQSLTSAHRVIIEVQYKGEPAYLPVEICRCETVADGMFQLGCRLDDHLAVEDAKLVQARETQQAQIHQAINGLLSERLQREVPDHERREHQRVEYTERVRVWSGAMETPRRAHARDLSKGGVAFVASFPLGMEEIDIELPSPDRSPIRLRAQVVRCREMTQGIYDIGTRFVDLLT